MAINRQDYQYVKNTLPTTISKVSDGSLQVGDVVVNLIPPLKDYQILNENKESLRGWQYDSHTVTTGRLYIPFEVKKGRSYVVQVIDAFGSTSTNAIYKIASAVTNPRVSSPHKIIKNADGTISIIFVGSRPNLLCEATIYFDTVKDGKIIEDNRTLSGSTGNTSLGHGYVSKPTLTGLVLGLSLTSGSVWTFNDYIHFYAHEDAVYYLSVGGVSFGYSLIDSPTSTTELRGLASPTQAKIFIFESDNSYVVDRNGVITGISSSPLVTKEEIRNTGLAISAYTEKERSEIFKSAPRMYINEDNELCFDVADPIVQSKWKFSNTPNIIIFRDFLTSTERNHNDKTQTTRYGILYTIQNTVKPEGDPYFKEGKINSIKFLSSSWDSDLMTYSVKLENGESHLSTTPKQQATPTTGDLAALGSNWKYSIDQGLGDDMRFKYTSVAFAWGYGGVVLSPISDPLIIDRAITDFSSTNIEFVMEEAREDNLYYKGKHILLTKK